MRLRSCGYPGSPATQETTDELDRFIEATQSGRLYNPWPEFVDARTPLEPWTNPLVRTWYMPTTQPEYLYNILVTVFRSGVYYIQDESLLPICMAILHENFHLMLDFTPAKKFARLCLAHCYTSIQIILEHTETGWTDLTQNEWENFKLWNERLSSAISHSTLAEELIVTAFSFTTLLATLDSSQVDLLESLEKEWISDQTDKIDKRFSDLYYSGFKKIAFEYEAMSDTRPGLKFSSLEALATLLEPLSFDGDLVTVSDTKKLCLDFAEFMAKPREYIRFPGLLEAHMSRYSKTIGPKIDSWLLHKTIEEYRSGYQSIKNIMSSLWAVSQGATVNRIMTDYGTNNADDFNVLEMFLTDRYPYSSGLHILLYPQETEDGRWYMNTYGPHISSIRGPNDEDKYHPFPRPFARIYDSGRDYINVRDRHLDILRLEALRQQLYQGVGILCPRVNIGQTASSWCSTREKRRMIRLSEWAMAGKFGPGKWTALSELC